MKITLKLHTSSFLLKQNKNFVAVYGFEIMKKIQWAEFISME